MSETTSSYLPRTLAHCCRTGSLLDRRCKQVGHHRSTEVNKGHVRSTHIIVGYEVRAVHKRSMHVTKLSRYGHSRSVGHQITISLQVTNVTMSLQVTTHNDTRIHYIITLHVTTLQSIPACRNTHAIACHNNTSDNAADDMVDVNV